jgi:hypothetical protein
VTPNCARPPHTSTPQPDLSLPTLVEDLCVRSFYAVMIRHWIGVMSIKFLGLHIHRQLLLDQTFITQHTRSITHAQQITTKVHNRDVRARSKRRQLCTRTNTTIFVVVVMFSKNQLLLSTA